MDKNILHSIVEQFGGADDEEIEGLREKLNYIGNTGRYDGLIKSISAANDKSNFLAAIFEATLAFQFESAQLPLEYEVKQDSDDDSSIDFLRRMDSGISIYIEARLLQQDAATEQSIKNQLESSNFYQIAMNGNDDRDSIIRLQSVILSKVQKKNGTPVKFLRVDKDIVNIVAINVSDLILGTIDIHDCLLSTCGDPYVDEMFKRGIFGLFQKALSGDSQEAHEIARSFVHVRNTLSGVLFLFKSSNSGSLNYELEQYFVWNRNLANDAHVEEVYSEIKRAIPMRQR